MCEFQTLMVSEKRTLMVYDGQTVESCDKKRQVGSANLMDKNAMA